MPAPAMVTLLRLTPLIVPSTHWIASYGLCSISALDTLIGPVIAPWLPSNHSAPTPNCQFGSRLPSRIMVLLEMVVEQLAIAAPGSAPFTSFSWCSRGSAMRSRCAAAAMVQPWISSDTSTMTKPMSK